MAPGGLPPLVDARALRLSSSGLVAVALQLSCASGASTEGGESEAESAGRPCGPGCVRDGVRARGEREGQAPHVLLAEDPLAAVRARLAPRQPAAGRQAGSGRPRLHHRLRGAGPRGQQEPEGQAAPDRQDDGPPLPLLRAGSRGRGARRLLERRRLHRRTRRGAPDRRTAARHQPGVPRQVRHPEREPRREGPGVEPHRHGDEPLQEARRTSTSARASTTRPRSAPRCSRS